MANDNKPKYARIGFVVLLGVLAIAGALVYLGGFERSDMEYLVESYYDRPVSGLSVGSTVNFRGVKIGEVRDIIMVRPRSEDFAVADIQRIRMLLSLDLRRMGHRSRPDEDEIRRMMERYVEHGMRATVSASGVTGLSRIELNMVADPPPVAQLSWKPRHVVIPPAPSLMEGFADAATRVMNQMNKMDFGSVWSNVQSIAESTAHLTANVDSLVEGQRANVGSIVNSVNDAAERLGEFVRRLEENPSLLLRPADPDPLPETSGQYR